MIKISAEKLNQAYSGLFESSNITNREEVQGDGELYEGET